MALTNITLTAQGWVDVLNGLYQSQELKGLKFAKKCLSNIQAIEKELRPLDNIMRPSPEFMAFAERIRTEAGNDPVKVKELEATEPLLVEERKEQLATLQVMLASEKTIEVNLFNSNELPTDMNTIQLKGIHVLINN